MKNERSPQNLPDSPANQEHTGRADFELMLSFILAQRVDQKTHPARVMSDAYPMKPLRRKTSDDRT